MRVLHMSVWNLWSDCHRSSNDKLTLTFSDPESESGAGSSPQRRLTGNVQGSEAKR